MKGPVSCTTGRIEVSLQQGPPDVAGFNVKLNLALLSHEGSSSDSFMYSAVFLCSLTRHIIPSSSVIKVSFLKAFLHFSVYCKTIQHHLRAVK